MKKGTAASGKGARGATGTRGATGKSGKPEAAAIPTGRSSPKFEERDIPRYDDPVFKGRLSDIHSLAVDIVGLHKRKSELEDLIREKSTIIQAEMEDINSSDSWSVKDDTWTASYIKPNPRKKLVPEKLVANGVSLAIIEKSTEYTPSKPYVQVRGRKEQSGYEED